MTQEERLRAYYGCPAFQASLEALSNVEVAQNLDIAHPTDAAHTALVEALDFWEGQIAAARATPEHQAVFGL